MIDEMKRVIKCKYCNHAEYYGEFRWLNGRMFCRNCYKHEWEHENKRPYIWKDLNGKRPDDSEVENE